MLHMGYVDEVLFGSEALERMPTIVKEWVALAKAAAKNSGSAPGVRAYRSSSQLVLPEEVGATNIESPKKPPRRNKK
jgi:hypothetical protein